MNWIIMPHVDVLDLTRTALLDCLAQAPLVPDLSILAINNGGRLPDLPVQDRRVLYWRYQPPLLSLSTVWNTALTMVWETGGEQALVVNNDVRLPRGTYAALLEVQRLTGAWFVSACNVGEAWYDGMLGQSAVVTESLLASRGGPDFSCFLITRACHTKYQFDEHFIPAYCEDCSYHRSMMLGGDGEKIFSVPVPYLHYGSGTLRGADAEKQARLQQQIDQGSRAYYQRLWGGPPNHEVYIRPFGPERYSGVTNPELQEWVRQGYRVQDLIDAVIRG